MSEGIIVRRPKLLLADYVGEYSFHGTTLRQANIKPMPSLIGLLNTVIRPSTGLDLAGGLGV